MRPRPSRQHSGTPRPGTPAGPTVPPGGSSERGPRPVATPHGPLPAGRGPLPGPPGLNRPVHPTVQQARSAISHFHAAAGTQKATIPPSTRRCPRRSRGGATRLRLSGQAGALTADALARIREVLRLPKRGRGERMESGDTARRRAALDLAIIGVLADSWLRRSEAAALTWGDVELWADGTGRLTIQKGKNQVEPATVAVTAATARALRGIRPDDVDPAAPVFGLTGETRANRVRAAARTAGLGDGFNWATFD